MCKSVVLIFLMILALSLTQDPCSFDKSSYSSWMGDIEDKSKNVLGSRRLNEILMGGSHDAGLWKIQYKSPLGVFFPDSYFKAQSRDLIGQLCSGARWFDMRITYNNGQWVLFHGVSLFVGYGVGIDTIISQVKEFLSYKKYSREIVFWRIKIDSGDTNFFSSYLRNELSGFIVDKSGDVTLPTMTLNEIWNQRDVGNLVIMEYGWSSPPVIPGKNQGWFWSYEENQMGKFSDTSNLPDMLTRCTYGQFPSLLSYKIVANNTGTKRPLFGIWWTYTTGNIQDNTNSQWSQYPTALNDFFTINNGEIGNFLLVDFFGDHSEVMKIIYDYNNNKYGTFPPLAPDHNYAILSNLPGSGLVNGGSSCVNVDSSMEVFARNYIIIFVVVLVVILCLVIGICIGVCCCVKKRKQKLEKTDNYLEMGS